MLKRLDFRVWTLTSYRVSLPRLYITPLNKEEEEDPAKVSEAYCKMTQSEICALEELATLSKAPTWRWSIWCLLHTYLNFRLFWSMWPATWWYHHHSSGSISSRRCSLLQSPFYESEPNLANILMCMTLWQVKAAAATSYRSISLTIKIVLKGSRSCCFLFLALWAAIAVADAGQIVSNLSNTYVDCLFSLITIWLCSERKQFSFTTAWWSERGIMS